MNKEIKAEWLADLRDGTRLQGHGQLRDSKGYQCCLDVLCEQAVRKGIIGEPKLEGLNPDSRVYVYYWTNESGVLESQSGTLPKPVRDWAGLMYFSPVIDDPVEQSTCSLATYNDSLGKSFLEIADLIEKYL